ncbi:ROK family protein [Pseudoclavibacter chungangensis]|uniref:ROK family protein n=1 Tax=Pseudoclavibacter chungangensis TaxID=587635 RepID=A0A7J5BQA4_9MICO|nr:ROK family protein [Pseudoclavibacter chungangensis]KAB1655978.1 ROK family protein [Pseudoclavibacter chungangensis]NYJ66425.1 polyphosphate glucokinase [Pseudoclavibacter chungangensis]
MGKATDKAHATAIGIDVGGTGIKGAVVDLATGELLTKRHKIPTPEGGDPGDIRDAVVTMVGELRELDTPLKKSSPIGVSLPTILKHGVSHSAANISQRWLGLDAAALFGDALGHEVTLVNDADAAGVAEVHYGAAKGRLDAVLVTTLGTGIGSALFHDGRLFPNTELGHLQLDGHEDYERFASAKVREREDLDMATWSARLTPYYRHLERLFAPDVFVVSGGISKRADEFLHLIDITTPIIPAELRNNAGIVGVAWLAGQHWG